MRVKISLFTLMVCACGAWTQIPPNAVADRQLALHSSTDVSAAAKRKARRATQPGTVWQPVRRGGPADPSFGPDGRPYQVPEYLRNQCYVDEGYGRFSACNNRN
jgi:hypothetical protein